MRTSNIVSQRLYVQESATLYEQSRWSLYGWWLVQGTLGGVLAGFMFSPILDSPWWLLPAYVAVVYALKRATVRLAKWTFTPDFWWQATSFFTATFLLACLACAVSLVTSWLVIALPVIIVASYIIGYFHTLYRVVFVRGQIAWYFAAPLLAIVATAGGWLTLHTQAHPFSDPTSTAIAGAIIGLLYPLLTTILLLLMGDLSFAQSYIGTRYVDKEEEFEEGLALHDSAIALSPTDSRLYAARADIYLKQERLDLAKGDIDYALMLDPRCVEARVLRADLLVESGELDRALAEYDELIDHQWGYQPALLQRARVYSLKGEFDRAFADFDRAARLGDDAALPLAYRAETQYRMGNYDAAIADCEAVMAMNAMKCWVYPMVQVTRGKCHAAKDELKLAVTDLHAALQRTRMPFIVKDAEDALNALGAEAGRSLFFDAEEVDEQES